VAKGEKWPTFREFVAMSTTFLMVLVSWIFFRADTVAIAVKYIRNLFRFNFKNGFQYLAIERYTVELVLLILFFLVFEWISREKEHPFFGKWIYFRIIIILIAIITLGVYSDITSFIYFQF
jgi:signal transduction histidine kinase